MTSFNSIRAVVLSAGQSLAVVVGLGFAGHAMAGCAPPRAPGAPESPSLSGSPFLPAFYTEGSYGSLLTVGEGEDWRRELHVLSIVGLWKFTFTSEGSQGIPDGAVVDAGYVTWHADGTELMNSGRPPITGSFCMGVWKPVGPSTFKLHHIALAWDPTGTVFVGPAEIRETVTVAPKGNSYVGKFTLDQFATDEKTVLAHVQGTVTATRVTVD